MQNTKASILTKKRIDFIHEPDLLDWQIMWISECIPYEADIHGVSLLISDVGQEVGIEIEYKIEGLKQVSQGFIN